MTHIEPGSAAEKAKLRTGDVIRSINTKVIQDPKHLNQILKSGKSHILQVERERVYYFVRITR